jgi:hypothetical protein
MSRPDFISKEDISRWDDNIQASLPKSLAESSLIKEVCYAGLWLCDELAKLSCPDFLIVRIQFTAAKLSVGRDPWDVSLKLLEQYKNDELIFEEDPEEIKN